MRRVLALALALLGVLPGCAQRDELSAAPEEGYGLWFLDTSGLGLTAVVREERDWETQPDAQTLMAELLSGPTEEGLGSPFPRGVSLRSITYGADGVLQVDLSEQYGGLTGAGLTVADCCITLTLCQLSGVEAVKITVEGEEIPYRSRQVLGTDDVLLSDISEEPEGFFAVLYFPRRDGTGLEAEYRRVERREGTGQAAVLVGELLQGPRAEGGAQLLPEETQVRRVEVEGGVCRLDLSAQFLQNAPQSEGQAALILYALVNTLCALPEVDRVQLLVEGEAIPLYGGVTVDTPLEADPEWIRAD